MTLFYKTYSWSQSGAGVPEETRKLWELLTDKKNWRIVQFQTDIIKQNIVRHLVNTVKIAKIVSGTM